VSAEEAIQPGEKLCRETTGEATVRWPPPDATKQPYQGWGSARSIQARPPRVWPCGTRCTAGRGETAVIERSGRIVWSLWF